MNKEYILLISVVIGLVVAGISHLVPSKSMHKVYITNAVTASAVAGFILYINTIVPADEIISGTAPF